MAGTSGVAALLGALPLGCLLALGLATTTPVAHADTPSPPPASTPVDEPVGGGDRTLTWLALAGAGMIALGAGGVVVLTGRRPDHVVSTPTPAVAEVTDPETAEEIETEVVPRRGITVPDRADVTLEALHLEDPLTLDSGIRPRRALHPIPDSSTTTPAPVEDTSWADWYESSEHPVRRGRRALPPEPDAEPGGDGVPENDVVPRRARD